MGSIRPLITIAILGAVGVYLYTKINEGPDPKARLTSAANQPPDGVPPLAATKGASLSTDSTAPAWPSTAPAVAPPPTAVTVASSAPNNTSSAASNATKTSATVPAIPDLPELPPLPGTTTTPSTTLTKDIPANTANASKENSAPVTPVAVNNTTTPVPGAAGASQMTLPPLSSSITPPSTQPASANTNPPGSASATVTNATTPAPQSAVQNPLRGSAPSAPAPGVVPEVPDRYGLTSPAAPTPPIQTPSPTAAMSSTSPSTTSFATSWPAIQAALDRNDLKQAHQLLSKWHGDQTLSIADSARVESLLSQLAGTVIYSTEHRLEPARVVKPGETLESIAKEYNVPWQLLAKINAVQSPAQLRPGQELKVVRGPFSAVVDLRRSELALMIDDSYAGKFPIAVPPGSTLADGQWVVDQKLADAVKATSAYAATPAASDRTIILRSAGATAGGPTLIIASSAPAAGLSASPSSVRVSPQDAEEISDILSVGSRVTVRR